MNTFKHLYKKYLNVSGKITMIKKIWFSRSFFIYFICKIILIKLYLSIQKKTAMNIKRERF